jgi:hypothetical protein
MRFSIGLHDKDPNAKCQTSIEVYNWQQSIYVIYFTILYVFFPNQAKFHFPIILYPSEFIKNKHLSHFGTCFAYLGREPGLASKNKGRVKNQSIQKSFT